MKFHNATKLNSRASKEPNMVQMTDEEREHLQKGPEAIERLIRERRALIYHLLLLYKSKCREGWEKGFTEGEAMDKASDYLANIGFDPCLEHKVEDFMADWESGKLRK
jgi:flagellar biosynthesis/type III secretory pathway protein FliH